MGPPLGIARSRTGCFQALALAPRQSSWRGAKAEEDGEEGELKLGRCYGALANRTIDDYGLDTGLPDLLRITQNLEFWPDLVPPLRQFSFRALEKQRNFCFGKSLPYKASTHASTTELPSSLPTANPTLSVVYTATTWTHAVSRAQRTKREWRLGPSAQHTQS